MPDGAGESARRLLRALVSIPGVESATLVGSFASASARRSSSDVDVVVVCDRLTRAIFDRCVAAAERLTGADLGRNGAGVRVNSTFGPLKFDDPNTVVVHLMIYDIGGHRDHVLDSPFTCLDWERSTIVEGRRLRDIYPVLRLQPRDFSNARRGIEDYLGDIRAGCITYRSYKWSADGAPTQIVERAPLDQRHRGEYTFHIIRNLLLNYAKMLRGANEPLTDGDTALFWEEHFQSARGLLPRIREIFAAKSEGAHQFPEHVVGTASEFLDEFGAELRRTWHDDSKRITWVRHARTGLNDGTFLGQRRDPSVDPGELMAANLDAKRLYSSPARRALETSAQLSPSTEITIDPRLSEQDYGEAEGLTFEQLRDRHPEIAAAWRQGSDPRFPGGENLDAVRRRLTAFSEEIAKEPVGPAVVVTHNVVLRELLGSLFLVDPGNRHRIQIPHLEPFATIVNCGRIYPDIARAQKAALTDALVAG